MINHPNRAKKRPENQAHRIAFTLLALGAYTLLMAIYSPLAVLTTSEVAGRQFENSDAAFLQSTYTATLLSHMTWFASLVLLAVLVLIWFKPAKAVIKKAMTTLAVALVACCALLVGHTQSYAFFDKTDRTEIIPVPPNWSAFWIPGFGANKDTQAQMNSEAYLSATCDQAALTGGTCHGKVAMKYFQVPHSKLSGSAGYSLFSGYDYYVNSGVLILVDRTRFSREWVDSSNRGTSNRAEGFPCQSKEGLNITVGVSIGTYVTEADAAKFLYNFGVANTAPYHPTGELAQDGASVFQSVNYGRSLKDVMDDVGRKKVQTLVCDQIGIRTFDKANADMIPIMQQVQKDAMTYFSSVGITLDFIGWADTFSFDGKVQDAVNRKYIALQDEDIAKRLQPYSSIIMALAQAQATRSFGDKTDGRLPTTFFGSPPAIIDQLVQGAAAGAKITPQK